jgi:hypothetical protein
VGDLCRTSTGLGELGRSFTRHFLTHFERPESLRALRTAAEYRLSDENVTADERKAIRCLVTTEGSPSPSHPPTLSAVNGTTSLPLAKTGDVADERALEEPMTSETANRLTRGGCPDARPTDEFSRRSPSH